MGIAVNHSTLAPRQSWRARLGLGPVLRGFFWGTMLVVSGCGVKGISSDCLVSPELCPVGTECDPETRLCQKLNVQSCRSADECSPDKPLCNASRCVACDQLSADKADSDCHALLPTLHACVRSGPRRGQCGECQKNSHCVDVERPVCDVAAGRCRPCQQHAECTDSGVCMLSGEALELSTLPSLQDLSKGSCVPRSRVLLVDGDRCQKGGTTDGSVEHPFCEVSAALAKGDLVAVRARQSGGYGAVSIERSTDGAGSVAIIGPGRDLTTPAVVGGVSVTGLGTRVLLSDLTVKSDATAVVCSTGAQLGLSRVVVQKSTIGVDAPSCGKLTIQQSLIASNRSYGLRLGSATKAYRVVNTQLSTNGQSQVGAAGVAFAAGPVGTFAWNTLISNGPPNQDGGGIQCDAMAAPVVISDSIVVQNGRKPGMDGQGFPLGTQFLGNCRLARVVVGLDAVSALAPNEGVARAIPDLDRDLRLLNTPNNRLIAIDKGKADDSVLVDFFGGERPRGMGYDLGSHELR